MDEARLMVENGYELVKERWPEPIKSGYKEHWSKWVDGRLTNLIIGHNGNVVEMHGTLEEVEIMLEYAKWLKDFDECL